MRSFNKNLVPSFNQKDKLERIKITQDQSKVKPLTDLISPGNINKEMVNIQR